MWNYFVSSYEQQIQEQRRQAEEDLRQMRQMAVQQQFNATNNIGLGALGSALGGGFVGHQIPQQYAAQATPVPNPEPNPVLLLTGEDE